MNHSKKPLWGAAVLVTGALALAGCAGTPTPAEDVPQTIAVAGNFPIVSLDPYGQYAADAGLNFVSKQVYGVLIVGDGDGGYLPQLATEWEVSDDGLAWTFTLREAEYSDGTAFTSADVKASADLMVNGGGSFAGQWKPIVVETPDERTVVFRTTTPGAAVLALIPQLEISPAGLASDPAFFAKPAGLGPFMVDSFESENEVVLVPNPNYWGEAPELEEVTIRSITDISARVTALLNDEVQAIWGVPDDQFGPLTENAAFETEVKPSWSAFTMWMNAQQPGLEDLEVRQAIWKAIDFAAIQEALYPYSATLSKAPVSQETVGAGDFEPYAYDPDAAREMLEDAGFGDGLTLRLQYSTARDFGQFAAAIKSDLAKVGVTLEVQSKEQAVWLEDLLALDFDINMQTTGPAGGDASADLSRLYRCSANRTGFCSDELDELIADADAQLDPQDRAAAFTKVQKFIWDNAIGMFPLDVATTYAWSTRLAGFAPDPNFAPDLSAVSVVAAP